MASAPSVLIIEDEPLISMMLEDFVESLGYTVSGTADGVDDALAYVRAGGFDLAILDVNLRGGAECWPIAQALRENGVPVIFSTGGHAGSVMEQFADAPVLIKPFTMDNVRAALARCMPADDPA